MNNFKFTIGQFVRITVSHELGEILGRAEYAHSENAYYIRYPASNGRATEAWWGESALIAVV